MNADSESDWANRLKGEWEQRSRSPDRDFFIMTHQGWSDEESFRQQGERDVEALTQGLSKEFLAQADLLEFGCGVGRLTLALAPQVNTYTGVDIAQGMIKEAKRRCGSLTNTRFFTTDGEGPPPEARDRSYDLILAHAVLIHCPKPLCKKIITTSAQCLKPKGQMRGQLYADPTDPERIEPPPEVNPSPLTPPPQDREIQDKNLIENTYWEGHRFSYQEAKQLLDQACPGTNTLHRFDPNFIYFIHTRDS